MQIELIEQHHAAPSTYQKWRDAAHEGLHHICIAVEDLAAVLDYRVRAGITIVEFARIAHQCVPKDQCS